MQESKPTLSSTPASFHRTWIAGVLVASLAAWGLLNFTPIQRATPPELLDVNMYSPPDIQARYAEVVPVLTWQNCLLRFASAGLAMGLVSSLFLAMTRSDRRGILIGVGTVGGLLFGLLTGQVGWSLRPLLNSPSIIAQMEEPIFRDTLLFVIVSIVLSGSLWLVYGLGRRELGGQQAFSVLMAGGLSGLLLPMAASAFPDMQTHVFPPEGLGLPAVWLGMLAVLASILPLVTGPRGTSAAATPEPVADTEPVADAKPAADAEPAGHAESAAHAPTDNRA